MRLVSLKPPCNSCTLLPSLIINPPRLLFSPSSFSPRRPICSVAGALMASTAMSNTNNWHHHQQQQQGGEYFCHQQRQLQKRYSHRHDEKTARARTIWGSIFDEEQQERDDEEETKERLVVIMGATGTGKTKLSIDLAELFSGEIINSDKIQVYSGLDITTNKVPFSDRRNIPHHLLGAVDPSSGELSPSRFSSLATAAVADISSRRRLPVLAGGSNSFIQSLLSPINPFDCCFLWVDVEPKLLEHYLDRRVDEMIAGGMVEELERYFSNSSFGKHVGLEKAIGVPEFREYFEQPEKLRREQDYRRAVEEIKENTRRLAEKQVGKIRRLMEEFKWPLKRLDATEVVKGKLAGVGKEVEQRAWEVNVLKPSADEVNRFLTEAGNEQQRRQQQCLRQKSPAIAAAAAAFS